MKVVAFTQGRDVPSARFRVRQYVEPLRKRGVVIDELFSRFGSYPPRSTVARPFWAALNLIEHAVGVCRSGAYDVAFLQREFLSTYYTLERFITVPMILDVDDAIFLYREGRFIKNIANSSAVVICGNSFLAGWFSTVNANVVVIPTGVDTEKYCSVDVRKKSSLVSIGWLGTSGNYNYLYEIEGALRVVLNRHRGCRFMVMADRPPKFSGPLDVEFVEWSGDGELDFLRQIDIGIMPLNDSLWSRGKCSFKMLQYMAMGLPVVVSPFGMNKEILDKGEVGFGPVSEEEWVDALTALINDESLRLRFGENGRRVVIENYSVDVVVQQLERVLKGVVGR